MHFLLHRIISPIKAVITTSAAIKRSSYTSRLYSTKFLVDVEPKRGAMNTLCSVLFSTIEKLTICYMTSWTNSTLAGISTLSIGRAIKIYSVLNMFQSCDMTPLSKRLTMNVRTKPAVKTLVAVSVI